MQRADTLPVTSTITPPQMAEESKSVPLIRSLADATIQPSLPFSESLYSCLLNVIGQLREQIQFFKNCLFQIVVEGL